MISLLQLEFIILIICCIIFIVTYIIQKRFEKTKDLIWDSIINAITLCSGIILLLFLIGSVFKINYLSSIDDFLLYTGLLIAGSGIISGSIENLRGKNHGKNKKTN